MVITASIGYFSLFQKGDKIKNTKTIKQELIGCLDEKKEVSYKIEEKESPLADVIVFVNDKFTGKELSSFKIENIRKNYHPIELHQCGVYVIKMFNYDPKKTKQDPGYKTELWKYDYSNKGKPVVLFHEKIDENGIKTYKSYYGTDFRVNPSEKYVALEKWTLTEFDRGGFVDGKDLSMAIKNLETKEDVFVLPANEIQKKNPNLAGGFDMREWTKDGRYFWGDIFDGADTLAFFRIEADTWKWEIFEAPAGTMGGTAFNSEYGYITYDDGPPWTGDVEFDEINKEKWLKESKKVHFYLYNLFTKKQILLATVDDPLWSFKPKWLSDTELQYELPSGEKKIYKIYDESI